MKNHTPGWISGIGIYLALFMFGLGALCWLAPHVLFGSEGYRTVARGIVGALGALSMGVSIATAWAVVKHRQAELSACLRILALAFAGIPAIAFYNLGALEPLRQATGINIFLFVGGGLLLLLLPASLALLALRKINVSSKEAA